jgi:hypothetical protein
MNGTVIFGAIAMFFIISGLVSFVNDLHEDVDSHGNYHESKELNSENYYSYNVIGERTLDLMELSETDKLKVWNGSSLKIEMMELFPDFSLMGELIDDSMIENNGFKERLLRNIERTEEKYIGGVLTGQSAKAALSSF